MSSSVWEDISNSPVEAELLRLRADAMTTLRTHINDQGWDDNESARRLGFTLSSFRDLKRGHLHAFSLEELVRAAATAGLQFQLDVRPN
ncbi:helix-turn-helix domain-containing protein [Prescottella equi]|uniref:helix-turn-helix domain-containing protein n=1 Tax=Rhodococcus hoagii TaxID=43767 RepID=UPI00158568DE|nr:XRE family transcriptional regulator [Prescottella equi]